MQHSSPSYPQSNGFIEAMVKTTKNIMEKAEESDSDPHLAMLIYRSTPIRPGQLSPAELLNTRMFACVQSHQSEELIGHPALPAKSVALTSPPTSTVGQTLPTQYSQDLTNPNIAASRPRPTVRPPKRLSEEV